MTRLIGYLLLMAVTLDVAHAQGTSPPSAAAAAVADHGALTSAQAQQALDLLQDPAKRAQLIETLQTIARAAPQPVQQPAPASAPSSSEPLTPGGLSAQLLLKLSRWAKSL